GELSEHIGRRMAFLIMGAIRIVGFPVLFLLMGGAATTTALMVYALLLSFIANGSYGPVLIFLNERFPTALRASGTGLSWNIGFALGGMMPTFVSLVTADPLDLPVTLAIFTTVTSIIYLIGAWIIPETKGNLRLG
ncbi:MAG: MFS transporter, partial [Acetobacteraceae bacterium]|nr:MFS transporter [Acetobacteraceae bacterium]